jgi:hypothetical protein
MFIHAVNYKHFCFEGSSGVLMWVYYSSFYCPRLAKFVTCDFLGLKRVYFNKLATDSFITHKIHE